MNAKLFGIFLSCCLLCSLLISGCKLGLSGAAGGGGDDGPAPVAVADTATTPVNTPVTINILANDSNPAGGILAVTMVELPPNGSTVLNSDQTVTYTPNNGFNGTDGFLYTIRNEEGRESGTAVTITVIAANLVAVTDTATTRENTPVTINLLANDSNPSGGTLTVTIVEPPVSGTAVLNADQTVTYTPNNGFSGTDGFLYTIRNEEGQESSTAVTITVIAANLVAVTDTATTRENTPVTINLLANDSNPSGGTLTVTIVEPPVSGTAVLNADQTVTYTPMAGFSGTDGFLYMIRNEEGRESSTAVTITVIAAVQVPVAVADTAMTRENTPVTINLLANDLNPAGGILTVTIVNPPASGSAVLNADQTVTYTPVADFSGTDSFVYMHSTGQK